MVEQIFLSRRNLQTLLNKLDRNRKAGGKESACTLVKYDNKHPVYPQTMEACKVTALENEEYYTNRKAGVVLDAPKR